MPCKLVISWFSILFVAVLGGPAQAQTIPEKCLEFTNLPDGSIVTEIDTEGWGKDCE